MQQEKCSMEKNISSKKKRLYNLCYRAKRKGYRIDTRTRTIFIPYTHADLIRWITVQNLNKEYGFEFQTEIC